MGPAPVLSDYQTAARAEYEPQLQADLTTSKADAAAKVANLESGKGQIQTDYTSAIDNLKDSVSHQSAQINQLYSSRLLGNFSGLQGNDMGMMFSKADRAQATIEQTRANRLAGIATEEANIGNSEIAGESALKSKYQGLEAGAASKNYDSAVKEYDTQQREARAQANADRTYNLEVAKFNASNSKDTSKGYTVQGKLSSGSQVDATGNVIKGSRSYNNGYEFMGPNKQPVSMAEYVAGKNGGQVNVNDVLDLLQNGSAYDRQIYRQVQASGLQDPQQVLQLIAQEDNRNYYGFGG